MQIGTDTVPPDIHVIVAVIVALCVIMVLVGFLSCVGLRISKYTPCGKAMVVDFYEGSSAVPAMPRETDFVLKHVTDAEFDRISEVCVGGQ